MKKLSFLLGLLTVSFASVAQFRGDTLSRIETIFSRYRPQNPGCQVAISRNGRILFSKAWGMADLEHQLPLTSQSIIEAGSVSKQFTAAAILLLEQQGKLTLDDDIRNYFPEMPDYGTPITLRRMMHHTSGLRDWGSVAGISGWPRTTKTYHNEDALDLIVRQKALNHKPGDEFLYSNSNYNLFAILVERVSGQSLADYTRKYLFEPAGMTHTQWRDDFRRIVRNRAIAYEKTDGGYETNMPNEYVYGNGGLLTTAEDLLKWNDFYWGGRFGSPSLLPRQLTVEVLTSGRPYPYAAGLYVTQNKGQQYVSHSGATASYRAFLERYPAQGLSIAWLSNTSEFDRAAANVVQELENLLVRDLSPETTQPEPTTTVTRKTTRSFPAEPLQPYTGRYWSDEAQAMFILSEKNGKLMLHQAPGVDLVLTQSEPDTFKVPDTDRGLDGAVIRFERDNQQVKGLRVTVSRARNVAFVRQP